MRDINVGTWAPQAKCFRNSDVCHSNRSEWLGGRHAGERIETTYTGSPVVSDRTRKVQLASVLLAEDHGVTRFGMERFLRDDMAVQIVRSFENLPAALTALKARPFDLAVLDLGLPGLVDIGQIRQIRQTWPAMRVVVMSGSHNRADILATLEAGAHGYILKTAPMPQVATHLEYIMSGEIYVPPLLADLTAPDLPDARNGLSEDAAPPMLPPRQLEVLQGMADGLTNKLIAARLGLSEGTVKMHATGLYQTLGVHKRPLAVIAGAKYLAKPEKK